MASIAIGCNFFRTFLTWIYPCHHLRFPHRKSVRRSRSLECQEVAVYSRFWAWWATHTANIKQMRKGRLVCVLLRPAPLKRYVEFRCPGALEAVALTPGLAMRRRPAQAFPAFRPGRHCRMTCRRQVTPYVESRLRRIE